MKIMVAIYPYGNRLQPQHISRMLAVEPSGAQAKAGPRYTSPRRSAKVGVWMLSSQIDSTSISDHVEELLGKIGNPVTPLDKLQDVEAAYLDVFITDDDAVARQTFEFMFLKDHIEALSRIGLSLRVTVM